MGEASGVNPKEKSGVGVPKAVCWYLHHHSGNSCVALVPGVSACFSPGPHQQRGEGGPVTWARTSPPNLLPWPAPGEVTPASPSAMAQHGGWQSPVISPWLVWRRVPGARGHPRRWEESLHSIGWLPPASNRAAPGQLGTTPPQPVCSIGCLGLRETDRQVVKPAHQAIRIKTTSARRFQS